MKTIFKSVANGILCFLTPFGWIIGIALGGVVAFIIFLCYAFVSLFLFFTGRNMLGDLPEDIKVREVKELEAKRNAALAAQQAAQPVPQAPYPQPYPQNPYVAPVPVVQPVYPQPQPVYPQQPQVVPQPVQPYPQTINVQPVPQQQVYPQAVERPVYPQQPIYPQPQQNQITPDDIKYNQPQQTVENKEVRE